MNKHTYLIHIPHSYTYRERERDLGRHVPCLTRVLSSHVLMENAVMFTEKLHTLALDSKPLPEDSQNDHSVNAKNCSVIQGVAARGVCTQHGCVFLKYFQSALGTPRYEELTVHADTTLTRTTNNPPTSTRLTVTSSTPKAWKAKTHTDTFLSVGFRPLSQLPGAPVSLTRAQLLAWSFNSKLRIRKLKLAQSALSL